MFINTHGLYLLRRQWHLQSWQPLTCGAKSPQLRNTDLVQSPHFISEVQVSQAHWIELVNHTVTTRSHTSELFPQNHAALISRWFNNTSKWIRSLDLAWVWILKLGGEPTLQRTSPSTKCNSWGPNATWKQFSQRLEKNACFSDLTPWNKGYLLFFEQVKYAKPLNSTRYT